jgi:hypothetical protein
MTYRPIFVIYKSLSYHLKCENEQIFNLAYFIHNQTNLIIFFLVIKIYCELRIFEKFKITFELHTIEMIVYYITGFFQFQKSNVFIGRLIKNYFVFFILFKHSIQIITRYHCN